MGSIRRDGRAEMGGKEARLGNNNGEEGGEC